MDRRLPVRVLAARLAEGLAGAAVVLSVLAWFASVWYRHRFGDTGFDSILFTILFDVEKAESGQFRSFLLEALLPGAVALLALAGFPCDRRVYNCFLNAVPPAPPERTKNRVFSPMDMYPTVLAAMGCTIPGERLGLGTNLFSGEPTLAEELGTAGLNAEIEKRSDEYLFKLVLGR